MVECVELLLDHKMLNKNIKERMAMQAANIVKLSDAHKKHLCVTI